MTIHAPFDPATIRTKFGAPVTSFTAPPVPQAVISLAGMMTPYNPNDPTQSQPDPVRQAVNAQTYADLIAFTIGVNNLADKYMLSNPANEDVRGAGLNQLAVWAYYNAMLSGIESNDALGRHQAIMWQAWFLAAWANATIKMGSSYSGIRAWFSSIAAYIVAEYTGTNNWTTSGGNHMFWAGYSVGQVAVVLNDQAKYDFAMDILTKALASVAADGSLPSEMWRADKSLMYQNFAMMPIAGLISLATANGRVFTAAEKDAISRLVVFSLTQSKDPTIVSAIAGATMAPMFTAADVTWVDLIIPTLQSFHPKLATAIGNAVGVIRPLNHVYLGGNVTRPYLSV